MTATTAPAGPRISGSIAGPSKHELLEPPPRGDRLALRWWWIGVASYFGLGSVFLGGLLANGQSSLMDLVGLGETVNPALFLLIVGGFVLTVVSMKHAWDDIRVMHKEEVDIQWLVDKGTDGLGMVFADPATRATLFNRGERFRPPDQKHRVETIIDHRVWRTRFASTDAGVSTMSGEAARAIAEKRITRLGGFARYASSLLLLLAVLGTFAGVKQALPELIKAVQAGSAGGTADLRGLERPLNFVADAFGGNALALIGAMAIGLIAQGIATGRRNLLERLELVSEAYVYDQNVAAGDDNPLTRAIVELRAAAVGFSESTGRLQGIETGLASLGADFRGAVSTLENRLADVVERDQGNMYDRTSSELTKLHATVTSLASATKAQVDLYSGLVDHIGERSRESQSVVEAARESNQRIGRILETLTATASTARSHLEQMEKGTRAVGNAAIETQKQVEAIRDATDSIVPALAQAEASFTRSAERLTGLEQRAGDAWRGSAQTFTEAVREMTDQQRTMLTTLTDDITKTLVIIAEKSNAVATRALAPRQSESGSESAAYLRQIATLLQERQASGPSVWMLVLLPMLGISVIAGLLVFLQ